MKLRFENFYTEAAADQFIAENLTYRNGSTKPHTKSYSDFWQCWVVFWRGNTIHKRSGKSA